MQMSAARDTRALCAPVTFTTGVQPRRPQVRPFGGLKSWPDSSSKQSQAPRSAAVLLPPATPPAARRNRHLIALGGRARGELHAPPDPVQQQVRPGQGVLHAEPPPDDLSDPSQRPALILI